MNPVIEILLIASVIATSSALVGVFLVLRRISLLSDAISHAILLGIVLAFFLVKDLTSPFLIIGAAIVGVLTVTATELLIATKKLKEDASIGLVFPILFALAVILINLFASNIHLDQDAVLLGELAFAPFERLTLFDLNLPRSLWISGIVLFVDLVFIMVFYKELKITTFDPSLAASLGFSPVLLHYGLMSLVSITAVGAFDAVGSILVVALMIAPPATAYLLTNHLWKMISLSIGIGLLSGISGYALAHWVDASIAGSMAMMTGVFFALAWLFAPERGLLAQLLNHRKKKLHFNASLLLVHLLDHEGTAIEEKENTMANAQRHMQWNSSFTQSIVAHALKRQWIEEKENILKLTEAGRKQAKEIMLTGKLETKAEKIEYTQTPYGCS